MFSLFIWWLGQVFGADEEAFASQVIGTLAITMDIFIYAFGFYSAVLFILGK